MALLDEKTRSEIRRRLADVPAPVKVLLFVDEAEDGREAEQMLLEVAGVSRIIQPRLYRRRRDRDAVAAYLVDGFPAFVVAGPSGTILRFFGIPRGFGFGVFFEAIKDAASGRASLPDEVRRKFQATLPVPVHIGVFVTPDCPLCTMASRAAQKLAVEVAGVSADIIQASEFPELVLRHGVRDIPAIVLNGCIRFPGAPSETTLAELVLRVSRWAGERLGRR